MSFSFRLQQQILNQNGANSIKLGDLKNWEKELKINLPLHSQGKEYEECISGIWEVVCRLKQPAAVALPFDQGADEKADLPSVLEGPSLPKFPHVKVQSESSLLYCMTYDFP